MRGIIMCLAILLNIQVIGASSTRIWEVNRYGEFLSGKFENVALDHTGTLRVAPELSTLHETDQAVVWSLVQSADGTIYFGTGHQGAVFQVSADGEGKLLWNAPEIEVLALAAGSDGSLYAGTAPNGKVYHIAASGDAKEFFDPGEKYIWSLEFDPQGFLMVGTGDQGKIYRVSPEGAGELWLESGQRHVMSLALDLDGKVLAGTDREGILYRIEERNKAFALYDSDLPEISSIAVADDGAIYFSAMGGGMDRMLQAIPSLQQMPVQVSVGGAQSAVQVSAPQVASAVAYSSQATVVYGGERSALMRLSSGKAIEKIWSSNEEHILDLVVRDDPGGDILFATDSEGRIYQTSSQRQLSLVSQTDKPQMTALLRTVNGVLMGSAHSGALYRLALESTAQGTYQSTVHDTSGVSQWGRLSWRQAAQDGTRLEISTRSGNTSRPDNSWSSWSESLIDPDGSLIASPPARFLQWRSTLYGKAQLGAVKLTYLPQNSAPVVKSVNVVPEAAQSSDSSRASSASSSTSSYSITVSGSGSSSAPEATSGSSKMPSGPIRKLAVVWGAEDPDGDKLRAEVFFRELGGSSWISVKENLPGPKFSLESDTLADGRYEFKVRVDDGRVNSAERTLSAERVSSPVLVDQTPPQISKLPAGTGDELRFVAEDAVSEIRQAEYAVDAGEWYPLLADDGILDSRREEFTLQVNDLPEGQHLVVLRVRDSAGNAALAKSLHP